MSARLELAQVQTLVLRGVHAAHGLQLLLSVREAPAARQFLAALCDEGLLSFGKPTDGRQDWLSLGLSYRGLQALGLDLAHLAVFDRQARAFAEGPHSRAAAHLADTGPSAAEYWEPAFAPDRLHLLLSLHDGSEQALRARLALLQTLPGAQAGLHGWDSPQASAQLPDPSGQGALRVHFGYRDGLSRIALDGSGPALGEFVLGLRNDSGFNRWLLADRPDLHGPLFHNASFGVLRKIEQDEAGFRAYVAAAAVQLGESRAYVMAKLCGRWPDGQLMLPGEREAPTAERVPEADFSFASDRRGQGCPFGAHIRRMNPRDDPLAVARRRLLLRRGMPYGPAYEQAGPGSAEPRGLMGMFFCASLEDQFEHLLAEWGNKNPLGPDNRGTAKDPLIGQHERGGGEHEIPMPGGPSRLLSGLRAFVRTRGTAYLFYPGRGGLQSLTGLGQSAACS